MKRTHFSYLVLNLVFFHSMLGQAFDPKEAFVAPSTAYFYTDKDYRQFQEFRGIQRGFEAGIDQLEFSKRIGKKLELNFDGHALIRNNDYNILLDLKNSSDPSKFKLKMGFLSFNRYYDPTGGYLATATTTNYDTEKLTLWDAKYFIETEFKLWGLQTLTKGTWHHKNGKISELNWGFGTQASNRKYAPSFSEIDEDVYEAELSFKKEITNGDLTLGQHLIYADDNPVRKEFDQNTNADRVVQSMNADSFNYAAHLSLFKALSEKTFTTLSYTAGFSDTTEKEDLATFNSTGGRVGGGTRKNYFGAKADNDTQKHILNAHLYREPLNNLSINLRLNTFYKERYSDSTYPRDTSSPPDLVIDQTTENNTEHSGYGLGEQLSFHYKGLHRWTPYVKLESEQNFLRLDEDFITSGSSADTFFRDTDQEVFKNLGAIGFYSYPWNWFKLSGEYNVNHDRDDYKDIRESPSSSGSEKSGFVDDMVRFSNAVKANVSMALTSWLQTGLRYQWKRTRFAMTPERGLSSTKGYSQSHHYTALFSILPQSEFSLVQMFSFNDSYTYTPARTASSVQLPRHQGDYKSALTSLEYRWSSALNFSLQHDYSWSNNFNNFSSSGLPLGVDDRYENFLFDVSWKLKSMTLTPSYGFGIYRTENKAHVDDYDYHSAMIQVKYVL